MRQFGKKSELPATKAVSSEKPTALVSNLPKNINTGVSNSTNVANLQIREEARKNVMNELLDVLDLPDLLKMPLEKAKSEIRELIRQLPSLTVENFTAKEEDIFIKGMVDDVLGFGPLETLLERNDIADIIVCGPDRVYIEVGGILQPAGVKFRDEAQLRSVCGRIVAGIGRRVDENSPICDARLPDGSRVAIVIPPISIDGTSLTIRKFKREKLSLENLIEFGSISKAGATVLEILSACRCNVIISGGTGSGKTTLLNILTRYIDPKEAIITCEDAAELQLQQQNVRRWETRPPNLEGTGEVTMSMLVKAALRHRPERIIIGEVRGKEAFDLLQAMNTGHDGSAGTVHANSPKEGIARVESMIAQGGYNLPARAVREQITSSVDVIVQATRMRDGSRKVTQISEVVGMEGDIVVLKDLMVFKFEKENDKGKIVGHFEMTGLRPKFFDKAKYYGFDKRLTAAMQSTPERTGDK